MHIISSDIHQFLNFLHHLLSSLSHLSPYLLSYSSHLTLPSFLFTLLLHYPLLALQPIFLIPSTQQLIHNIVQNQWSTQQSTFDGMYPMNIPNGLEAQQQQLILQQQAAYVEHLPTEIAQAVVEKKLPPEFYTYRQNNSQNRLFD